MKSEKLEKNIVNIEGNFNHQLIIAEGVSGMLFQATMGDEVGSISNSILNSNAYAIQNSIHEMNKSFEILLDLYYQSNKN